MQLVAVGTQSIQGTWQMVQIELECSGDLAVALLETALGQCRVCRSATLRGRNTRSGGSWAGQQATTHPLSVSGAPVASVVR
jgi:hypothetical protein